MCITKFCNCLLKLWLSGFYKTLAVVLVTVRNEQNSDFTKAAFQVHVRKNESDFSKKCYLSKSEVKRFAFVLSERKKGLLTLVNGRLWLPASRNSKREEKVEGYVHGARPAEMTPFAVCVQVGGQGFEDKPSHLSLAIVQDDN